MDWLTQLLAATADDGSVNIPLAYMVAVVVALSGAIGILYRCNVKLYGMILKEKEEKVSVLAELRKMAEDKRRRKNDEE